MTGLAILISFLVLVMLGVPLGVSMGLPSVVYILSKGIPLSILAQRMVNSINSYPLLAVVLFIFVGNLMNTSRITDRLFNAVKLFVGSIRGGLAHVNVLGSLVFAGMSGAALADVGGLGNVEIKAMKDQGYKLETALAITLASATIGPIFPPSIPLIIYATVAEVSGVKLLIAGIVPALLITICLMIAIALIAKRENFPKEKILLSRREKAKTLVLAFPALIFPFLLTGGLLSGLFSPTEMSGMAVVYTIILGVGIYRELDFKSFWRMARETVLSTANIMFIISVAAVFGWVLAVEQVPQQMTAFLLGISSNRYVLLLIVNLLLLIVGMFMESNAAILIFTPLIAPALLSVGVDPVHLGIVVVLNLMIGLLTPPVGMSLYMGSIVSGLPFEKVTRATLPWVIPLMVALLIVTFFPSISTWIPNLVFIH
ncbi:MAG: TRAP transporter large permease [Firmicutes bacterium]|nr:TRAP transporter large permease [Bacillota bacterium]